MKPAFTLFFIGSLALILSSSAQVVSADEKVTFYSTYGFKEGNDWVIPLRAWVHERRGLSEALVVRVAASMDELDAEGLGNFRARTRDMAADSESDEDITLAFDQDPENRLYRIQNLQGSFPETDLNGLIEGVVKVPIPKATELLNRQGSRHGWLTFRATSSENSGTGRVRLIESSGLSVISDIDDTIKITEIPAGSRIVVRNTFFRDFAAAPGMAEMYRGWEGASFHYVSGGPWQLYEPLSQFLFSAEGGFPEGTFHMKNVRKNLLSMSSWEDLKALVTDENVTMNQKISQISEILRRFPERKFILVGDSGEKDPEVYRKIKNKFGDQVLEIKIRDVVNDREKNRRRLEGMTVIPAPTVVKGVSQLAN